MDKPEKLAAFGTQDEDKQNKTKQTQHRKKKKPNKMRNTNPTEIRG
jgi:hypothetical protein